MAMWRVRTVMTGVAGAPYYNNLFFNDTGDPPTTALITEVKEFWASLADYSSLAMQGVVEAQMVEIDPATGDIVSAVSGTAGTFTGGRSGATIPPSSQGLLQVTTGTYEGGRQVRGRVFIPSLSVEAGTAVPATGVRTAWETAGDALIGDALSAGFEWVIWSRKNGIQRTVTNTSAWTQYAVLRSRRD